MANLASYLAELAPLVRGRFPDPGWSSVHRRATERLVQISVESIIDINALIIADAQAAPPISARDGVERVCALGIIDTRLRDRLSDEYVKLRNRIVHAYDTLDARTVFYKAQRLVKETRQYQRAVDRYIGKRRVVSSKRNKKQAA